MRKKSPASAATAASGGWRSSAPFCAKISPLASDLDLLVEYLPGRHPGLMLFRQQDELAARLRRPVDLHTPASLSRHFRDAVLATALPIYEQA